MPISPYCFFHQFAIYRYPSSEFYFAREVEVLPLESNGIEKVQDNPQLGGNESVPDSASHPTAKDSSAVVAPEKLRPHRAITPKCFCSKSMLFEQGEQADISLNTNCTFVPTLQTKVTMTIITGDSRDGSGHLHAFDLFRKSAFFRREYLHKDALRQEMPRRIPRPWKESDYLWPVVSSGRVDDCLYKPAPVRDLMAEEDSALDPVTCRFTKEETAALGKALDVTAAMVWECDAWGTRRSSDRSGAAYFDRLSKKWAYITRAGGEHALDATLPRPADSPSTRTLRILHHASALDRRIADPTEFDFGHPEVQDERHAAAVQLARTRTGYARLQRSVNDRARTSIRENRGVFTPIVRPFLDFLRAHNENSQRFQDLLSSAGQSGGHNFVRHPICLFFSMFYAHKYLLLQTMKLPL
jgi:hypothetical protein